MSQAVIFGASGGIGAALVEAVVASGRYERVWAGSRSGQTASAGATPFTFDLTDEASIAAAARQIGAGVTLAFVATGVLSDGPDLQPEKSYKAQGPAAYARAFATNATGPALIGKHFLALLPGASGQSLRRSRPGSARLVIIASAAGTPIAPARRRST